MIKLTTIFLLCLMLTTLAIAEESGGDLIGKQAECIQLPQECTLCTDVKLTTITFPNMSRVSIQTSMTQDGTSYYYQFCNTTSLGAYSYCTQGDTDGSGTYDTSACNDFEITSTGQKSDTSQGFMIVGQLGLVGLFLAMAFGFRKEKWKIRTFFFMGALFMGLLVLNSLRVIAGGSQIISTMTDIGLYVGIIILAFMFLYILVYYTIEVFSYFKEKRRMKWETSQL